MQSKTLSIISQYFAVPPISGFPHFTRATVTDVLKTSATRRRVINENGVSFFVLMPTCKLGNQKYKIKNVNLKIY